MASLISFLGQAVKNVENGIGGAVNNVEHAVGGAVNNVAHAITPQQQQQIPQRPQFTQVQQRPLTIPRPIPQPTIPHPQPGIQLPNIGQTLGNIGKGVGGFVHDAANSIVNDAKPVVNTIGGTGAAAIGAVTGQNNDPNYQAQVATMLNHGVVPNNVMTGKATPAQFAGDIAKTGVHYAPYFVGGPGALTEKFGNTVAAKVGNGIVGTVAGKAATAGAQAAIAAPTFAGLNAVQQGLETGKFNPAQAIQTGLQAGAMTAGGAIAGDLLKGGSHAVVNGIKNTDFKAQDGFAKIPNVPIKGQQPLFNDAHVPQKANINDVAKALGTTPEKLSSSQSASILGHDSPGSLGSSQTLAEKPSTTPLASDHRSAPIQAGKEQNLGTKIKDRQKIPAGRTQTESSKPSSSVDKYTTNSTKVNVDEVKPDDYQKVRSNAQRIESNVNVRARQAIHSINRLPATDKSKFWNVVEGTAKSTGAKMDTAISKWRQLSDHVHATSIALGGDTPHLGNYARHNWDLSDPTEAQRFTDLMNQKFNDTSGRTISPEDFKGIDNKPRAFDTIKQGEALGFKLKNAGNPAKDIADYVNGANSKLKTQSVAKGMQEAEAHISDSEKSVSQHIGYKSNITTTQRGAHELRALYESPQPKFTKGQKAVAFYDQANRNTKATILSLSQFHTANIGMQALPALVAKGHPIRAINAALDTVGVTFSPKAADGMINEAIKDGTIDNAARIGTPILEGNDFNASGKLSLNAARGEKLIFERQLPAMHIQMVKAVVADLKKKGISLDSPQARAAGNEVHQIMGYMNKTLNNMSSRNMRGASRVMLAPNFTISKWAVLKDAFTKGGQAGQYARAAVIGKYAAEAALIAGVGAIAGQKSDDIKDTLLRALIHPSIPTPMKDSKGNTIELGLPSNYLSEGLGLVSQLNRGTDGRLGVNVNPANIPQNLENYGQGRLAAIPAMGLKVATNQNYAGKPLYDPAASFGSKVAQASTTLGAGVLPIGLQNLVYTQPVKNALGSIPGVGGDIKNVLNAGTPGANPLFKGVLSAVGMTPRTDKTVGQGLQTTQYFNALSQAGQGLNAHETDIFKQLTDSKKNPVTGQYDTAPSVYDSTAKANDLLQNPKVLTNLTSMNQSLQKQGQTVDPLYNLTPQQQTQILQINRLDPGNPDKTQLQKAVSAQPWYKNFQAAQTTYYNSLPAGDPNRPQAPVKYQTPSQQAQDLATQYYNLTDPTAKSNFIKNNPNVQEAFNATAQYDTAIRAARGDPALKGYPTASPILQQKLNAYDALATKAQKTAFGKANPDIYNYFQQVSQYSLENDAKQASYVGNNFTQKGAKAITSLANNIKYDGGLQDSSGNIVTGTGTGSTSGSSRSKGGRKASGTTAYKNAVKASFKLKTYKVAKVPTFKSSTKVFKAPSLKKFTVGNIKTPNVPLKKRSQVA